jgi:FecR protein
LAKLAGADMSSEPCTRVRDAAAASRVFGDAALKEHAAQCEVCGNELAVLQKRRDFRDAFPVLMSIADESKRPSPRARANGSARKFPRRTFLLMLAALIVMIGVLTRNGVFRARSDSPPPDEAAAAGPPTFHIYNLADAIFESKKLGGVVQSSMTRGVAAFHVEPLGPGQRFLLALPDGNLEVRGTRFVVMIERGKTQSVEVSEGTVALRMDGGAEMLLSAGQRWPAAAAERPSVSFMRLAPRRDGGPSEPATPND